MKTLFLFLIMLNVQYSKLYAQQNIDIGKLRFCIGKINAINVLFRDAEIRKPVITNNILEDDEFNSIWQGLINETKNFTQVSLGKEYEIEKDYLSWKIQFISPTKFKMNMHNDCCGRAASYDYYLLFDLLNSQYTLKFENTTCGNGGGEYAYRCSTENIIIKNDKIIQRYRTN